MFKVGEKIVYGKTGVCEVIEITEMAAGGAKKEPYYILKPIFQSDSKIFTPVNNNKIAMRPIISKEEAENLLALIPKIKAEPFKANARRDLLEHYESVLGSQSCEELVRLAMSVYAKKQIAEKNKKTIGALDERFMKKAEEMLYGELAAVYGLEKDEVFGFIKKRIDEK